MVNFKDWNMSNLGHVVLVGILVIVMIVLMHVFVGPLLVTIMPSVFTTSFSLTDTLLFLILVRLVMK